MYLAEENIQCFLRQLQRGGGGGGQYNNYYFKLVFSNSNIYIVINFCI